MVKSVTFDPQARANQYLCSEGIIAINLPILFKDTRRAILEILYVFKFL
jgi:hypothetical protein